MSRVERHAAEESAGKKVRKENNISVAENNKKDKVKMTLPGKFFNILGILIILAAVVACLGLTVPHYAGIEPYVIVSGSMEPEIPVGSMVYAAETEPDELEPGDIIVFYPGSEIAGVSSDDAEAAADEEAAQKAAKKTPVTHRVVKNNVKKGKLTTKGDANTQNDQQAVLYENVIGKVIFHLPTLGFVATTFATPIGKLAAAMVILAGFLLAGVGRSMRR